MQQLSGAPRPQGSVGGFDWKSVSIFLLVLFLTNVAATQYVADHFRYQRALGTPLVRAGSFALYQPLNWVVWALRYSGSHNPAVSKPVLMGPVLVCAGIFLAIGTYAFLSVQRAKRLAKANEDIHGSARWATPEEIRESGLMNSGKGVYVGGWYDDKKNYL